MSDSTPVSRHSGETPLLQTVGLTKRYGTFLANDSIDIDIWPKEIHALLGENGAGKSTLVKTIYGLIQPSEGEMRWEGKRMVLSGPSEARSRGIGMVFQHFSLFDNLTVAENARVFHPSIRGFGWRRRAGLLIRDKLDEIFPGHGVAADDLVQDLSIGRRQMVEIARAFSVSDQPARLVLQLSRLMQCLKFHKHHRRDFEFFALGQTQRGRAQSGNPALGEPDHHVGVDLEHPRSGVSLRRQ